MPITGEIGGIPKKYVVYGGGGLVIVVGVVIYRSRKANAAAQSATVTDPAGNVCASLDPNSGFCPGTSQDMAYQNANGVLTGTNSASYVGGQIVGYDQYGNPIYSGNSANTSNTGPGTFTNNSTWAQAAQQYLVQQEPNADPQLIATSLGLYISGKAVTTDEANIVDQAIAFMGLPPIAGPNGDPPNVITSSTGGSGGGGGGTTKPTTAPGLSVTGHKGFADFGWNTITGAATYTLQVDGKTVQATSATHMEHLTLAKGHHTARVNAVNSAGSGPWSSTKSFNVT